MTKGTKIIAVLLGITMLWTAFITLAFFACGKTLVLDNDYNIIVAGVDVTRSNKDDILGDGTVSYNASTNTLIFDNAHIEFDNAIVYTTTDLKIMLYGENKFICKDADYIAAISAIEYDLYKDLSINGDGTLTIEYQNVTANAQAIVAADLFLGSDVTITTTDCTGTVNGIVCSSSLLLVNKSTVTVNNGAGTYSAAVRVRGNTFLEEGTALYICANGGTTDTCKGLSVNGDLYLGKNSTLHVDIDDEDAEKGECIRVTGLLEVGTGSTVSASAKKTNAITCYGVMELNEEATLSAQSAGADADVLCYGALVNYGTAVDAEINALGGIHDLVR